MFNFLKNILSGNNADLQNILESGPTILDVRTAFEFKGGHHKGAVNIPLDAISANISKIKKFKQPIVTCCASGQRSGVAANQLKAAGIEAYNGGSWNAVANAAKSVQV